MLGRSFRGRLLALVVGGMAVASCHMLSGHADLAPRRAALGQPCSVRGDCETGECVDGVCCGNPCEGPCLACDLPDRVGTCTPVPAFEDPDGDCEVGVCDGSGRCAIGQTGAVTWLEAGRNQQVLDLALGPLDEVVAVGSYIGAIDGIEELSDIDGDGEPNQWRLQLSVNGTPEGSSAIEAPSTSGFVGDIAAAILPDGTPLWGHTRRYPDGERDVWVSSPDGTWSLRLGEPNIVERLVAMDAAPDGDLVLVGTFGAQLDLGPAGTLDGGEDAWFVIKVGPDAVPRWGRVLRATTSSFGDPGSLVLTDVEAGSRIALTGSFEGAVDAAGSLLVTDRPAGLVAAFALDGTPEWVVAPTFSEAPQLGPDDPPATGPARATHVAVAPGGDVVAAFDGGAVPGARLVRYDGDDATSIWTRPIGPPLAPEGTGTLEITALAAGIDGDLHLGVTLAGSFEVAGQRFDGPGEALTLRTSANGGYLAATSLGQGDVGALTVDSHGDVIVGATLFGQLGPAPLEPLVANGDDAVLIKLRSDGTALWRRIYGDGGKPIVTSSLASAGEAGPVMGGVVTGELAPQGSSFVGEDSGCTVDGFIVRRPPDQDPWQQSFRGCFGGGSGVDDMAVSATPEGWVFALGSTGAETASRVEYGAPGTSPSAVTVVPNDPPDLGGFLVGIDPIRAGMGHPADWELRLPMVGTPRLMANGRGGVVAAFERPLRDEEDPFGPIDVRELPHEGGQQRWRYEVGLNEACSGAEARCLRDIYAGDGGVALLTWATSQPGCDPSSVVASCVTVLAQDGTTGRLVWERPFPELRLDAVALRPDNSAFVAGSLLGAAAQLAPDVGLVGDAAQVGVVVEMRSDGFPVSAINLGCLGLARGRVHGTDLELWGDTVVVVGQAASAGAPLLPVPGGPSYPSVDTTFVAKLAHGAKAASAIGDDCPAVGESAWRELWVREIRGLAQQAPLVAVRRSDGVVLVAGSAQGDLVVAGETEPNGGEAYLVELQP